MAGMEMAGAANQPLEIPFDQVLIEEAFAWGSYGIIHRGQMFEGERATTVAFKQLQGDNVDFDFDRELTTMSALNHRNILRLLGETRSIEGIRYMIFEYMVNRSLDQWLENTGQTFGVVKGDTYIRELSLIDIGLQIADGMMYLENNQVVHRDLAARNILLADDLRIRIADFGLARNIGEQESYQMIRGSVYPLRWTAPEALQTGAFNSKSDVWSFGVLLWEMFSFGRIPYEYFGSNEIKEYVAAGNNLQRPDACPEVVYELMLQCWQLNPENRPSFQTIFKNIYNIIKEMLLLPFLEMYINWDEGSRKFLPRQEIWNITDLPADIRGRWGLVNWPIPLCNLLREIGEPEQPQGGQIIQLV